MLEDPWAAPPEDAFVLTVAPAAAPAPVEVVIGFEAGLPVSLDGEELPLAELVAALNELAGAYGIGRIDMIENRVVGIKSRELYEAPAAMTLIEAHHALEDLVLTKAELHREARARAEVGAARLRRPLVHAGARARYDAFFAETQELVTGEVRLALQSGAAIVNGPALASTRSTREQLASYGTGETFPHEAAEGFIRIARRSRRSSPRRGAAAGRSRV